MDELTQNITGLKKSFDGSRFWIFRDADSSMEMVIPAIRSGVPRLYLFKNLTTIMQRHKFDSIRN